MKQAEDKRTYELIPTRRGRGRPATGEARTPAERKRDQRERDRELIFGANTDEARLTETGLIEAIGLPAKFSELSKAAWLELGRRRGWLP